MPRFSIVVPAHNVEPYIRECLDSLVNQTFGDFEVICVDDASTDNTRAVIEEYCARDERVRLVVNPINMHLFATRHIGVRETTGEYVTFVDGDDALTLDALENLDALLREDPVDILQFCMKVELEKGIELKDDTWCFVRYESKRLEGEDIVLTVCFDQAEDMCTHHRMFRGDLARTVLPALGFERNLHVSEDITEQIALMLAADSYRLVNPADYYIYNLGRGQNGGFAMITGEEFERISLAKWRCYRALARYLDDNNLHEVRTDEAITWRWRYACAQTLWHWLGAVVPKDRLSTLQSFAKLWPIGWVLPSLYQFVADDIEEILFPGTVFESNRTIDPQEDLLINLQCLTSLFKYYNRNPVEPELSAQAWDMMAQEIRECTTKGAEIPPRVLLACMRGICLFARNEEWYADDKLKHLDIVDQKLEQTRADLDDITTSRLFRFTTYLATPYRAIRLMGSDGK